MNNKTVDNEDYKIIDDEIIEYKGRLPWVFNLEIKKDDLRLDYEDNEYIEKMWRGLKEQVKYGDFKRICDLVSEPDYQYEMKCYIESQIFKNGERRIGFYNLFFEDDNI
jgi:hypothetical protein